MFKAALRFGLIIATFMVPAISLAETLTLGSVTENVKKHLQRLTPLAAELEVQLAGVGVTKVRIKVLPSSAAMIEALRTGEVDIYVDSPLVAAQVAREAGALPFLRRWKDGVASYHSVIVVRDDSGIEDIEDLRGRRIGFQDPDSTSGFMLPAGLIGSAGLPLRELQRRDETPAPDEVGYLFTQDDHNTMGWIYRGWIDAAATDPESWAELSAAAPEDFRIIARSVDVPRQTVVRRADMDPAVVEQLHRALTQMHETQDGRFILKSFNDTTRFDDFPQGVDATFDPIHTLLDQLVGLGII